MTFTILALDASGRAIGVATASRSLAVGAAVPSLDPAVGAVASQAWTNPLLRDRLLTAMAEGDSPEAAMGRIPSWDPESDRRQAAALGLDGRGAAHTGCATSPWQGHVVEHGLVVAGNLLAGGDVLTAMVRALGAPEGPAALAMAMVEALKAGEAAGGDLRGRQSAALLVAEVGSDTVAFDLRVDDADDPLARLGTLTRLRASALRS